MAQLTILKPIKSYKFQRIGPLIFSQKIIIILPYLSFCSFRFDKTDPLTLPLEFVIIVLYFLIKLQVCQHFLDYKVSVFLSLYSKWIRHVCTPKDIICLYYRLTLEKIRQPFWSIKESLPVTEVEEIKRSLLNKLNLECSIIQIR